MKTTPFVLSDSTHNALNRIEANDLSVEQATRIRVIVINQYMNSVDYKLKRGAEPFLQGYRLAPLNLRVREDNHASWVLVEFWSDDRVAQQTLVDHINNQLGLLPKNSNHFHTNECFGKYNSETSRYPLKCGKESNGG
jgi:hypothetical protein